MSQSQSEGDKQIQQGAMIGMSQADVVALEKKLMEKRSAKDQKETLRDVLRVAADWSCWSSWNELVHKRAY